MMLSNSSRLEYSFSRISQNFLSMYRKRAFVFWYVGCGLSEGFFEEGIEKVAYLEKDYREISNDSNVN